MKTFHQSAVDLLNAFCVLPNQVTAIIERVKGLDSNKDMLNRWNDPVSDYPPVMKNLMDNIVLSEALVWLKENAPQAWFIPAIEQALA